MYLLNGENKHCIEFSDRGFQYGDGLFETIEVIDGVPLFLDQHIQRLDLGCKKLLIPTPNIEMLRNEAFQLSKNSDKAVLKLIVTRGSGGRGYRQPDTIQATRLLSLHPYPDYPEKLLEFGIRAIFCNARLGLNPALARIKHMNRLEQIIARSEWTTPAIQEGIMMDINEHVIEGTMSNIFLVKNNCLYTPVIFQCGVEGILRNIVISLANEDKIQFIEKTLLKGDIYSADEVFVTNSIIGIWPVKQIEKQIYKVGAITKRLQHLFLAFKHFNLT